jgi:transcriptional regulator with XRE-family HTH domain
LEIGELLKKIRGRDSLREASEKTGLSHSYISLIEKGVDPRTKSPLKPSPETLKAYSDGYGYPYDELMKAAGYLQTEDEPKNETELDRKKKEIINFIRSSNDPKEIELTLEVVKKMLGK